MRRVTRNRAPSHEWIAPKQIHHAAVDPSTCLVLSQGCRPEHGLAVLELFIRGREPASACPRGTPEPGGPGVLAKLITWSEGQFKRARTWIASRFGNEKPVRERKAREHYLGAPKLPARADAPAPALPADSRRLFGEEVVIPDGPPGNAETLGAGGVTQPDPGDRVLTPGDTSLVQEPAAVDERVGTGGRERGRGANPDR